MKTQSALAARAIKAELKKAFPEIKFSVTSENFSMGDAVSIGYFDGVTVAQVEAITNKYQYGTFDGMTDCYNSTNKRKDIPQSKYVQVSRRISEETKAELLKEVQATYKEAANLEYNDYFEEFGEYMYTLVRRIFWKKDFTQTWWEKLLTA